jgi:hypothetical protein
MILDFKGIKFHVRDVIQSEYCEYIGGGASLKLFFSDKRIHEFKYRTPDDCLDDYIEFVNAVKEIGTAHIVQNIEGDVDRTVYHWPKNA